jgi:pimeloyl-ACP methyl ester carboxylesterase
MDAVREALGDDKVSFYGASYGSLIGEQYAERYPQHVRALALDGVMDHSVGLGMFLIQETAAAEDSFGEFVAWCARDPRCVLHGQDVPKLWAALMARARAGTLQNPYDPPAKLDVAGLIEAAFAAFYDPQWYSFAYYLRDAAGLKPKGRDAPPLPLDLAPYSFSAVICTDWYLPITGFADLHRRLGILAARYPLMLASPLAANATAGCLGWPHPPANPQKVLAAPPGLPPVLLVGTRHDPATAHVWAEQVAKQLGPGATLLSYEGWGHVAYKRSACVSDAVDEYLLTLVRPAAGATCPPVEPQPYGVG